MSEHLDTLGSERLLAQESLCRSLAPRASDGELGQMLQIMADIYATAARAAATESRQQEV